MCKAAKVHLKLLLKVKNKDICKYKVWTLHTEAYLKTHSLGKCCKICKVKRFKS